MRRTVVLDSSPLSLFVLRQDVPAAEECRRWVRAHVTAGTQLVVPEIVIYELRRELLRLDKQWSLGVLDEFVSSPVGRYIPLTSAAMRRAAELWARARRMGMPTAPPEALDIDVILSAQCLVQGWPESDYVVATSNVSHLSRFVPAAEWRSIVPPPPPPSPSPPAVTPPPP